MKWPYPAQEAALPAEIISIVSASMLLIARARFASSGSCDIGGSNNTVIRVIIPYESASSGIMSEPDNPAFGVNLIRDIDGINRGCLARKCAPNYSRSPKIGGS